MEFIKVSLLFLMTIAFGSSLPTDLIRNTDHSINECKEFAKKPFLIYGEHVEVQGKFLKYQTYIISFPKAIPNQDLIHCILVEDIKHDGTGGYPQIISGGVGFFHTDIQLKSQLSKGLQFNINIYADK